MTPEELLKPRYKCIADYPQSIWKVGDILPEFPPSWCKENLDKFPHIFKPLQWWEERKESDMPQYLKVLGDKERPIPTGVYKVRHYSGTGNDHVRFETNETGYMSWFLPATEQEYLTQKQPQ